MNTHPQTKRISPVLIVGIVLFILCAISLYIRIALPYDQIFRDGWVAFKGVDPYYHMRLVDNTLHHFPHSIAFDPYTFYPHGIGTQFRPFFGWLVAGIAWIIGLGSPSQHTINSVGAYIPTILGTLTIIPIYFIGKELFNRWVGVLSAALVIILPGEFLNRSLLGFTDHHVAEALFSTIAILFLILAIKKAKEREISFAHLINRDWATIVKPIIYTILAGVFLGIYLLTWGGGLLFVFIIFVYLIIQFLIDHLRSKSTDYLCIIGTLTFLIATIMLFAFLGKSVQSIYHISLPIAILTPLALSGISRLMVNKELKPVYYPLAIVGLVVVSLAVFLAINPSLFGSMFKHFSIFNPGATKLTIIEARPLLFPHGHFTLDVAWVNFTTSFFISFISLGLLIYTTIKEKSADKALFLVWSILMLAAVLGQRRFSYYFAINAALLTGYLSWRILEFAGIKKLLTRPKEVVKEVVKVTKKTKKAKRKKKARAETTKKRLLQPSATWIKVVVAGVAIFFLVFFPNIGKTEMLAKGPPLITQGWRNSMLWLKDKTPEPCGPDFYYELYDPPPPGEDYEYPETAYGVLSWWDYGHWITRIGRRMPNATPAGQVNAVEAARFLTAQNETSANQIMDELDSKYVISDNQMPTGKFYAFLVFAGRSEDEFFETYYHPAEGGRLNPVRLYYPAYYHSMVVRLYNFDCQEVVPTDSTIVISWEKKLSREGRWYKEITGSWSFPTYEEAEAYISIQESGNYKVVGVDPFTSPVPLKELKHYKLIYRSDELVNIGDNRNMPEVKIFEYTKGE